MSGKQPLPYLTGLRGIAAYSILLSHAIENYWIYPRSWNADPLTYFGMTLFFVLSGFVITYNYSTWFAEKPFLRAAGSFLLARIARIYPLYILFVMVCIPYLLHERFFYYITMTQAWGNHYSNIFENSWSVSVEWFLYLFFLPLVLLLNRIKRKSTLNVVVCLSIPLALTYHYIYYNEFIIPAAAEDHLWLIQHSPYAYVPTFLLGCLAAVAYQLYGTTHSPRNMRLIAPLCCVIILYIMYKTLFSPFESEALTYMPQNFLYAPFIALYMFSLLRYGGFGQRFLSSGFMLFLGSISYSVYIIQPWLIHSFSPGQLLNIPIFMIMTTLFAYGTYALWEVPARRWLREQFRIKHKIDDFSAIK